MCGRRIQRDPDPRFINAIANFFWEGEAPAEPADRSLRKLSGSFALPENYLPARPSWTAPGFDSRRGDSKSFPRRRESTELPVIDSRLRGSD